MAKIAITTTDNPYNPITDFENWYAFDEGMGYHTCSYLARIAKCANGLPDDVNDQIVEAAIDEIVKFDVLGKYKKVIA